MIPLFGATGAATEKVKIELRKKTGEILKTLTVRRGANLWVALRRFGIPVGASCSGVGVCGKCAVREIPSTGKSLTQKTEFELQTLTKQGLDPDARIACLCRVEADVTVTADYW